MKATASLYFELIKPALNCSSTPTITPPTTAPRDPHAAQHGSGETLECEQRADIVAGSAWWG